MYPLSFREFVDFHGYQLKEYKTPIGEKKKGLLMRVMKLLKFEIYLMRI